MLKSFILVIYNIIDMKKNCILTLILIAIFISSNAQQNRIIDHTCIDLGKIPDEYITKAKSDLHIYFGHKSHGSHLTAGGMSAIVNYSSENATKYAYNSTGSGGALKIYEGDLYYPPVEGWVQMARNYLDANPDCNVVIWGPSNSFVSGELNDGSVGYNNAVDFINEVEALISEYGPGGSLNRTVPVTFVYMTPPSLSRYPTNWAQPVDKYSIGIFRADSLLRKYCTDHDRWLFDYYDLSTHNPDGENFGGRNDADYSYDPTKRASDDCSYSLDDASHTRANWAIDWVSAHPAEENSLMAADEICTNCQHSDGIENGGTIPQNARLTCVMKGKAAWWLWASLAGWQDNQGVPTAVDPADPDNYPRYEVFPNPSDKMITINSKLAGSTQIKIVDLSGRIVFEGKFEVFPVTIDLGKNSLATGIYNIVMIGEDNSVVTQKIVFEKKW